MILSANWYNLANKVIENPLIEDYSDVLLEQINHKIPEFLPVDEYREVLTEMATELKLDRVIMYKIPMADGTNRVEKPTIIELINPYWCRKTFVKLGFALGWSFEKIMQYSGHTEPKTIKHYFDQLSAEEKQRL